MTVAPATATAPAAPVVTVNNAPVTVNITPNVVLSRATVFKMKVGELKSTLSARGMNTNGQEAELMLRLIDGLNL